MKKFLRAASEGWLTRQLKSLEAVLVKPDLSVVELSEAVESL